ATARERLAMLDTAERSAAPAAPNANAGATPPAPSGTPAAGLAIPPSTIMPPKPATSLSPSPVAPPLRQSATPTGNVVASRSPPLLIQTVAPPAAVGLRLALVIGNGAYVNATPLANPPNDATVVAKTLRDIGFEVIEGTNLDRAGMERVVREFLR